MAGLLEGKAGIVTGAAGGIGRGIAVELAREGAFVLVSDLDTEAARAEETIALCVQAGGEASWQACDVTSAEAQDALVGNVVEAHGRLDFAVNNAGVAVHKPLTEVTDQEYARVLDINLKGIFLGLRPQVRQMAE
jgi:NAD(P)-dependent dehydrogenase (short-subunit alcohol dehydrogenase family)